MSESTPSSCRIYMQIYCLEGYLVKLSKANRFVLTMLRTSNSKLSITVGRYNNIRREDRVSEKCDAVEIGMNTTFC